MEEYLIGNRYSWTEYQSYQSALNDHIDHLESQLKEKDEDKTQFLRRWMTFANEKELTNKESQIFENSIEKFLKPNQRNDGEY